MSLLDAITGGKSSDASDALEQALAAINGVQTPTAADLQFQIQQMVQNGQITPEQAQTYLANPSAFLSENIPQEGTQAQETAISDLLGAADQGGLNPDEQEQMRQIIQGLDTQENGANEADVQSAAARGSLTGGETLASELEGNQQADVNANELGSGTAANAYNAMLSELTSAGNLGSGLQGEENTQANTVAAATDAINKFNAAQQEEEATFNTQNETEAQAANVETGQNIEEGNVANENAHALQQSQLPQQVYEDQLQKAEAEAGVNETQAQQDTTQGGQQASLIGGIVGAGGEVGAGLDSPTPTFAAPAVAAASPAPAAPVTAASGGMIHDYLRGGLVRPDTPQEKAVIPGNSPKNDKIPALLSDGEVVLPRTVTQNPQPDKVMAFLNRIRKPKTPHPDDVATVLHAMGKVRNAA